MHLHVCLAGNTVNVAKFEQVAIVCDMLISTQCFQIVSIVAL